MIEQRLAATVLCLATLAPPLTLSPPAFAQSGWTPTRAVELIAPANPGGGPDVTARAVQRVWQGRNEPATPATVINKPGGNYGVSWAYLSQHRGDPHYLLMASLGLLTNRITGANAIDHADATTIAQLFSEYLLFAVRSDSPLRTGRDLMRQLAERPESASFGVGGSAAGGIGHLAAAMAARAAGMPARRLRVIAFRSSAEIATAVLGGHVDVAVANAAGVLRHAEAGSLRLIAVTAPGRQAGALAAVPTWREQGVPMTFDNVRFVLGAAGLQPGHTAYWEKSFESLSVSEEWRRHLETNLWSAAHLGSSDARKALDQRQAELRALLGELGMAKD